MSKILLVILFIICCFIFAACHKHDIEPQVTIMEATCTKDGAYIGVCECGETKTVVINALGHDEIFHDSQEPTCTEIGWDAYVSCLRCHYSTYNELPANGHNWLNGLCTVCGELVPSDGLYYSLYVGDVYGVGIGNCKDKNIVIPSSYDGKPVRYIDGESFRYNQTIESITIPNSVTKILSSFAFSDCSGLTSINVYENNPYFQSIDGNLYSKDGKTLIQYAVGKKDTFFTIPSSVTSIGEGAFYGCTNLETIIIPNSLTSIGEFAFGHSYELTNVIFEQGCQLTNLAFEAFGGCNKLTSIVLPDGLTKIDNYAFSFCSNLTTITIPSSVTNIGVGAFENCTSIKTVYYKGTLEQWKKIPYEKDNICLFAGELICNYVDD